MPNPQRRRLSRSLARFRGTGTPGASRLIQNAQVQTCTTTLLLPVPPIVEVFLRFATASPLFLVCALSAFPRTAGPLQDFSRYVDGLVRCLVIALASLLLPQFEIHPKSATCDSCPSRTATAMKPRILASAIRPFLVASSSPSDVCSQARAVSFVLFWLKVQVTAGISNLGIPTRVSPFYQISRQFRSDL